MTVQTTLGSQTINQICLLFRHGQLNLNPGFQRQSVWTWSDRRRLVESIFAGFPLPSIFLYKREERGRLIYDVIDGKQRLESIFMFAELGRFKREAFDAKIDFGDGPDWEDWQSIKRRHPKRRAQFDSYSLQTVEVTGDLSEIVDLFVRINSTGKRLTSGEKRHARFYTSPFLKAAQALVEKNERYFRTSQILSPGQLSRMKGTELCAELLMSLNNGGAINKKIGLDRAIGNESINGNTLGKIVREFNRTIGLLKRMFPDLHQTRLRNSAEFYSLFLLVAEMDREGLVLVDRGRNSNAWELLRRLSSGVDDLRAQLRQAKAPKHPERIYQDYLLTVQGDTDSAATRERRAKILKGLLWSLFERKDSQRLFTPEQRRVLWHMDTNPKCARCGRNISWVDYTVDHRRAHSRGGRTELRNAKAMHRRCNSSKGARE